MYRIETLLNKENHKTHIQISLKQVQITVVSVIKHSSLIIENTVIWTAQIDVVETRGGVIDFFFLTVITKLILWSQTVFESLYLTPSAVNLFNQHF